MACFLDPTYPHFVHQARRQTHGEQLSLSAIFNVMSSGKRRNSTLPSMNLCFGKKHVANGHFNTCRVMVETMITIYSLTISRHGMSL